MQRVWKLVALVPIAAAPVLILACTPGQLAAPSSPVLDEHRTWRDYGGGPDSSKYVALEQITKENVGELEVAWTYFNGASFFNPIVVDEVMYVLARNSSLVALEAATGEEIWIHTGLNGIARRGINYWESADRSDRRLIFQINGNLQAIDAQTGLSILSFGDDGIVDLRQGLGRDPETVFRIQSGTPGRIFENLIIVGSSTGESFLSPPGDIRAYDVVTGELVWQFHTVPRPGEFGYETWPADAWQYVGGNNVWGEMSIDVERGILYAPTGSPTYDMYGADRLGENLFGNCLLALDARTGERLWHFQAVHHDLWDYDLAAAPQLLTVTHDGRRIDAVAQAAKHGFLFVFDRVTGEPLWPIEERPVPPSDVPGEMAWPTQPFPTVLPPFARQSFTVEDLNPFFLTPEERAEWTTRLANARNEGLFTPPAYQRDTVQIPGARGGSNWGTTSADPERGLVFLLTQDWPSIVNVVGPSLSGDDEARSSAPGEAAYQQFCQSCHGADRAGTAIGTSLVDLGSRMTFEAFRQIVAAGQGQMPANPMLVDSPALEPLYAFLTSAAVDAGGPDGGPGGRRGGGGWGPGSGEAAPMTGPVVAEGGVPGGLEPRFTEGQMRALYGNDNRFVGAPYPEGVVAPTVRLYSDYGLDFEYIIGPPWSSIVAYDLNEGEIKWRRALGEDAEAVAEGGKDTGILRGGEWRSIIVTATGLLFVNGADGKLRAYDAETGDVLWSYTMPAGTSGMPAMYEVDDRQYLVVPSMGQPRSGRRSGGFGGSAESQGYVAFALPAAR